MRNIDPTRRGILVAVPAITAAIAPAAANVLSGLPAQPAPVADNPETLSAATIDYAAALARLEHIIETLRGAYVSKNFKLDEGAAARALNHFRAAAAGKTDGDDPEWQAEETAALEFIYDHGQSLDWIIGGDMRVMICKAASHSDRANVAAANVLTEARP